MLLLLVPKKKGSAYKNGCCVDVAYTIKEVCPNGDNYIFKKIGGVFFLVVLGG